MEFAKRMDRFGEGIFSVLLGMKKEQLAQGRHVVDLSVGTPNIPPAQHVIDALVSAAQDRGNYVYAISDTAELQDAVAAWYRRRYGVEVDPRREVVSLLGSQEGLAHIALSVVDEGETVLVPDPCYPVFGGGPLIAGAKLWYMPQRRENGYIIDLAEIPEEVARAAKLMVVSYPNNPTTAIAPLFVLWFGYGIWSKVLVTVLITFFPITITVYVSQAPSLDDLYVDLAAG